VPSGEGSSQLWTSRVKPLVDFLFALIGLILTTPLILLLMLAVRLTSKGPALYTQRRLGLAGRTITILKIRTMYQDSEKDGKAVWSRPGDPRVTPLGRFLRATHLDELPQLWNILRGEMSLVGPRPERPEIIFSLERVFPEYRRRLEVRPGLTGLAQVLQGPDCSLMTVRNKLHFDLHYLERGGFWMDCRILVATALHLLRLPAPLIALLFGFPATDSFRLTAPDDCECRAAVSAPITEYAK